MKKNEKVLLNFVKEAERMSGFDSYDEGDMSAFDDMDNFDGDEMSYFDGDDMSYATGNKLQLSDPYVIQYENTVAVNVTAILFGFNDFAGTANFGNVGTTTITNLQGGTYARLFNQSQNKQFKIGKWRFQSSTPSQLQQTLTLTHVDGNGKQYTTPLNLSIMKDAYQQQADVLDVTKTLTIDGNSYISFTLIASATLVISMFPISVISAKAKLNGGTSINNAKAPRLSGKNVAPVIIQTSQAVQGIAQK